MPQHVPYHPIVLSHGVPSHLCAPGDDTVVCLVGVNFHILPDLPLLLGEFLPQLPKEIQEVEKQEKTAEVKYKTNKISVEECQHLTEKLEALELYKLHYGAVGEIF